MVCFKIGMGCVSKEETMSKNHRHSYLLFLSRFLGMHVFDLGVDLC